ncbi:MAG: hypothetical protein D6678_02920 [Zetaproteobacteria bacterium]|nr:MAG: hypothetical protein D6678_02920 [Zetaproteobacteria bacterium]
MTDAAARIARHCWRREGVWGERSCDRLAGLRHCRHCPVFHQAGQEVLNRELDASEVRRRTEDVARPLDVRLVGGESLLVFRLGAAWLGLHAAACARVEGMVALHPVPHMRDTLLLGLANARGVVCLCLDLARMLGLRADPGDARGRRLVRLRWAPGDLAFVADEIAGMQRFHASALEGLPDTLSDEQRRWLRGTYHWRGQHIAVLDDTRLKQAFRGWRG